MNTNTANDLIRISVASATITHAAGAPDLKAALLLESDDSAENGAVTEFWGTDDDGDAWRVHITTAVTVYITDDAYNGEGEAFANWLADGGADVTQAAGPDPRTEPYDDADRDPAKPTTQQWDDYCAAA